MDRDRIARWIHDTSSTNAAEVNPALSDRSDVSAESKSRNRSSGSKLRPETDNLPDNVTHLLGGMVARGQLVLETGLNGLSQQTETTWSSVSEYWVSILPSCGQCSPTAKTQAVKSSRPERVKTAMLFNQYEKSKRPRQQHNVSE
jgi:hypothetical protein